MRKNRMMNYLVLPHQVQDFLPLKNFPHPYKFLARLMNLLMICLLSFNMSLFPMEEESSHAPPTVDSFSGSTLSQTTAAQEPPIFTPASSHPTDVSDVTTHAPSSGSVLVLPDNPPPKLYRSPSSNQKTVYISGILLSSCALLTKLSFLINIAPVHVRGKCFEISPTLINQFLKHSLPTDYSVTLPLPEQLTLELSSGSVHQ
ncbi:flocculation protein FLO11-like [Cucumis melo var. makuwa]|uniref:Flocculation protein FLO11-like n=1 Tax=Cucumis melo var. makuwa TaxID=1194695 RepID=A0A5A7SPF4_CUCMM|nr:flocculation protein FLO11-like [Cucumis melo var. makuwa]TYK21471.1 flocculation protein FLO11-like [Cucumis melo var. makuwa]